MSSQSMETTLNLSQETYSSTLQTQEKILSALLPDLTITFGDKDLTLCSTSSSVNYFELFYEPVIHVCHALQSYFSLSNDVGLLFPFLDLEIHMNSVYAEEITLSHIYSLHQGLFLSVVSFTAVLKEKKTSFMSRYNYLLSQLPSMNNNHYCAPMKSDHNEKTDVMTSSLFENFMSSSSENNRIPQENHYEYEPQENHPLLSFNGQIQSHLSNPSHCLEADDDDDLDLSEESTTSSIVPSENSLYEIIPSTITTTHRSELSLSSRPNISLSADLTERDSIPFINTNQYIPKSLDVGEEEVGDEGADEDLDIIGDGDYFECVGESGSAEVAKINVGECVVNDREDDRILSLTAAADDTVQDEVLSSSSNPILNTLSLSSKYEEIHESEEEGSLINDDVDLSSLQDSDAVYDSPQMTYTKSRLFKKEQVEKAQQPETALHSSTNKRKHTERDDDSPLLKRSRLEHSLNDERNPSSHPLDSSISSSLIHDQDDSLVIFVNDIEEELDDNELDLGLYEEVSF